MEDIDAKDQGRPVGTKRARRDVMQISNRRHKRDQRQPREKYDFILSVRQPLLVILVIFLLLPELFHQLAFAITVHHREGLILAILRIFSDMRVIIRDDKEMTKSLRKKGREEEKHN